MVTRMVQQVCRNQHVKDAAMGLFVQNATSLLLWALAVAHVFPEHTTMELVHYSQVVRALNFPGFVTAFSYAAVMIWRDDRRNRHRSR